MKQVDMSSEAITRRLRQTDQLRELCLSLMKAKRESDAQKAAEAQATTVEKEIFAEHKKQLGVS